MKKLKKMKNVINFVLCFAMLISVIQISPQNVYAAKKIKLNKTKVILYVGENYYLNLYDGKSQVLDLKWKSSNKDVAKVNEIGNIKALKKGKVKITVKYKNKKYVCNVIVKDALKDHVSYELIDIGTEHFIKVVNKNGVDVSVPLKLKQVDSDGYIIKNIKRNISVYKNNTTYYYIGSIREDNDNHDNIALSIYDNVKKNNELVQIDTSVNIYTKEEEGIKNKYCDIILKNDQKIDANYYRFSVLEKDETGNYIQSHVSDMSIPEKSKVKDTIIIDEKIQSVDVFLFENY